MRKLLLIVLTTSCIPTSARAQQRKIEISPFAGGYFNSGYQSTTGIIDILGGIVRQGEPHSGIFGFRASHDLTSSLSVEGTFAFSPAGQWIRREGGILFLVPLPSAAPTATGNTFHYAGNILYEFYDRQGWAPFFTAGAGAVTRTAVNQSSTLLLGINSAVGTAPVTQTNPSLNVGGGVKKYFTDRYGIRLDFRSYISQPSGDTVNNMEVSFGLIFRL